MPENTNTPTVAPVKPAAPATPVVPPYVPRKIPLPAEAGSGDHVATWSNWITRLEIVKHKETKADGTIETKETRSDYLVPDVEGEDGPNTIENQVAFLRFAALAQEEKVEGSGVAYLDKQIEKLAEGPNDVLFNDDGTENLPAYVGAYAVSPSRGGLTEKKIDAEVADCHRELGEISMIMRQTDAEVQKQMLAAHGFESKSSAIARVDTIAQKITRLSKTAHELAIRKQEKLAAKARKEAGDKAAAAVVAAQKKAA